MVDLKSLGYITISTNDIGRWPQFAFGVLEVRDRAALQRVKATLDGAGVAFKQLSVDEAETRRVGTYYTAEEITADSYWGHQWVGEMPAAMRL